MTITPERRAQNSRAGKIGGHAVQAIHGDRLARSARAGFRAKFERQVDPEGVLPEEERQRRADQALRAHMARLALKSSKTRSKRAAEKRAATKGGLDPVRVQAEADAAMHAAADTKKEPGAATPDSESSAA